MVLMAALVVMSGCRHPRVSGPATRYPRMTVTGYCPCKKCTGWKRNWLFRPVFASGSLKGQRKKVGVTADGTKARKGVIAADTRYFPLGTVMHVPGYGWGVVHDRGSAINERHIDLFFPRHKEALAWGKKKLTIKVWRPKKK